MKKVISLILVATVVLAATSCEKSKQQYTCTCNWTNILGEQKSQTYQLDEYTRKDAVNNCNMRHVNTVWPGNCYLQ